MEKKETKFIRRKCKIHGEIDFYTYKGRHYKCIICAKEKSKEWKSKNSERVRKCIDIWQSKNQDLIKKYNEKAKAESKRIRLERRKNFYDKFGGLILDVSSKISLKKIPVKIDYIIRNPTEEKIKEYLINKRRYELYNHEAYRISTMIKYKHLKSLNLRSATEEQKAIIRDEYKRKANLFADREIKKIIKNLEK